MNLAASLSVTDLSTVARVKALAEETSSDWDAWFTAELAAVSYEIALFMGRHIVTAERTEDYELGIGRSVLTLDAAPCSAIGTVIYAPDRAFTATTAMNTREYSTSLPGGWVRLHQPSYYSPGYLRLTYTGGLGADTAAIVVAYPDIARAVDLEVVHRWRRRDTLDGNVKTMSGGATMHEGPLKLHPETRRRLAPYRRVA